MNLLVEELLRRIRSVLGDTRVPIPLHVPVLGQAEKDSLSACVDSGWVSSAGPDVSRLEEQLCAFTGAPHTIAVVNGTCGLYLSLHGAGVGSGDEVIMSPLTFVATGNAVAQLGATPHFVDADATTLGLNPDALRSRLDSVATPTTSGCINRETGRRIAAIVPVHVLGHPSRITEVVEIAARHEIPVVEDAAESLGSFRDGRHTGRWGRFGVISFNGNKVITTGGGGAILCECSSEAARIRHLATTAKLAHPWRFDHDSVAFNFRMPNLNAALGLAQMARLQELLDRKRRLADAYASALAGLDGVEFIGEPNGTKSNYWLNSIRLNIRHPTLLEEALTAMHTRGYLARPLWTPLSQLPMFHTAPRGDLSEAIRLAQTVICLPSSPGLAKD